MTFPLTRSRSRARFFGTPFSPVSLFANGEQGTWYDPSDLTTLFQDAAGTTPTVMETRARLMLDKSGRGNHATAPSDASSPILRARYNLLTYSENLLLQPTASNSVAALNATTLRVASSGSSRSWGQFFTAVAGAYTALISMRAGTAARMALGIEKSGWQTATATIVSGPGTISLGAGIAGIAFVDNLSTSADTLVRLTGTVTAGTFTLYFFPGSDASGSNQTINDTIVINYQDVRTSTDAALNIPAYQSITTATSYDTAGFPPYLAFDGTDDGMSTASIDFTGTPQMTVFAGVTKLSDAAGAIVVELSAAIASNNGAFLIQAPSSAAANNVRFTSKGTIAREVNIESAPGPVTRVVTGIGDIGGDVAQIRSNGVVTGTSTSDQGTGNYGNYPLFIGRRNNTDQPLNGRIYSLIIRGAATTTPLIASTEQWVAGKMRLPI